MSSIDIVANPYKKDFPLLDTMPDLAFLDSAATAQRPQKVLDALDSFVLVQSVPLHENSDNRSHFFLRGFLTDSVRMSRAWHHAFPHFAIALYHTLNNLSNDTAYLENRSRLMLTLRLDLTRLLPIICY